ncbi:hypothetical protein EYV94_14700 [Puteibacter caeruleilacunae]|nr:hypothetical protein EYV94_14700 [Puteibacter caeruleilacunae]
MKFSRIQGGIVSFILMIFLLGIGCKESNDIPGGETGEYIDHWKSSMDTSLVHIKDEYDAVFLENIAFAIEAEQYEGLNEISFKVLAKNETSEVEPFTVTYSKDYVESSEFFDRELEQLTFPVFGLFDNHQNSVFVTTNFANGRSWEKSITIETAEYPNTENENLTVYSSLKNTTVNYLLLETDFGAMIMDVEGNIRWAASEFVENPSKSAIFKNNAFFCKKGTKPFDELLKLGFDGSQSTIAFDFGDYPGVGFHHEMDMGKEGFFLEAHIKDGKAFHKRGSVLVEVDEDGKVLETWDLDEIIGKCIAESGGNITDFVRNATNNPKAEDWFHMNSSYYDKRDNSVLISSRENFVIKVGYDDKEIKWILGDQSKYWYSIDTLKHYALDLTEGNINIGQHALSILDNGELLMFNNGNNSSVSYFPKDKLGLEYQNSKVSGYIISNEQKTARESFNIELPFACPNRGCVQKSKNSFIVTSLPVQPEFNSLIGIYDEDGKLISEIKNTGYFCVRTEGFSNELTY